MEKKPFKINKKPNILEEDLNKLTKDDLIKKIITLRAHNSQLKNIIEKLNQKGLGNEINKRKHDFDKSHKRHVLLKFLYFGWEYQGFTEQEDTTATIEFHLFRALQKTCLIESRQSSNYNRCGRTDKEVSAFCQVISIDLRSKFPEHEQMMPDNIQNEIDYCYMLNRVLPKNIKCISWAPLSSKSFSARFDCLERTYKYFFPKGNLNIEAMRLGCKFLIGIHDFRNLCKMDVGNGVVNFTRTVINAEINLCNSSQNDKSSGYIMCYFKITSKAFLWHQIRCIMAILILIGEEKEDPSIISELLNVEKNPCKPQYSLANGISLNLYDCEFRENDLISYVNKSDSEDNILENTNLDEQNCSEEIPIKEWVYSKDNLHRLIQNMQTQWSEFSIKQTMIHEMLKDLEKIYCEKFESDDLDFQANILLQGAKQKQHQKLMNRKRCESLENRLDHYVKKQRLIATENYKTEKITE